MNYFIIGDIHGCYYTLCRMLEHWHPETEHLVAVGDLIDRGNYSSLVIKHVMELSRNYSHATFIKGNHEVEIIEHAATGYNHNWMAQCGRKTLDDFEAHNLSLPDAVAWMRQMPLKLETDVLLVSHAGLSATEDPFDENNNDGVCWNRKPLIPVGKLQVHGHTPLKGKPALYTPASDSWNIDTAAVLRFWSERTEGKYRWESNRTDFYSDRPQGY